MGIDMDTSNINVHVFFSLQNNIFRLILFGLFLIIIIYLSSP